MRGLNATALLVCPLYLIQHKGGAPTLTENEAVTIHPGSVEHEDFGQTTHHRALQGIPALPPGPLPPLRDLQGIAAQRENDLHAERILHREVIETRSKLQSL